MTHSHGTRTALIVFAKSPVQGTVKTRMWPNLSETECLVLHEALVRYTLTKINRLSSRDLEKSLFLTGSKEQVERYAKGLGVPDGITIEAQVGNDLGDRLINALEEKFKSGFSRVVCIGTDCPLLQIEEIEFAIESLSDHEVVIGPTTDGGYYLIGFSANIPALLQGIAWGTSQVYGQTLDLMRLRGVRWQRLKEGTDVDTFRDLKDLCAAMESSSSHQEKELCQFVSQLVTGAYQKNK